MKLILLSSIASLLLFLPACQSLKQNQTIKPEKWFNVAIAEDVEIYTDTASIRHEGAVAYAREKRVFITPESRKIYVDKIRSEYEKMGKPEKVEKWSDFSYCIYECMYECTNKRFKILSVEDYDSTGKLIIKTKPSKKIERWLDVETETVGDYTFFFVCDYE
ncbi:MAG: hypothetical protein LBV43_05330 [Prevotella sp.]|jgi:hypothetical protein|nr:hypothetical protein [Prevotella sp.]